MADKEEQGPPEWDADFYDVDDPDTIRNDPNHHHSFDSTAGDAEYIGEPEYCWGVVWFCVCGEQRVIADEALDAEFAKEDEQERRSRKGGGP